MALANYTNRTIWTGDNLPIMRGMNSESVDLIYLDPPFNSKANYAAPIGSTAAGAEFKDTWTLSDIDEAWLTLLADKPQQKRLWRVIQAAMSNSDKSYLIYMAMRLLEMERLLKPTGSIYLHCDSTMSHYLKLAMDAVFGRKNFRNEIAWCYTGPSNTKRWFPRKHDVVFWYTKSNDWTFNADAVRVPYIKLETGKTSGIFKQAATLDSSGKVPESWWTNFTPVGRIKHERTGYPTQKPLALLERIIKASSNEGDMVLDPFCGCATSLVAADRLDRQWVGIDISGLAVKLVERRIKDDQGLFQNITPRIDNPQRTDLGKLALYNSLDNRKFLYGEQEGRCNGCKEWFKMQNFTVDHIIAQSKGGTDHIANLQLLCGYCNSVKGNRGQEYLISKLAA